MKYIVYLRTNLVNGKQYVGQTKNFQKREREWKCLKHRYANSILSDDREKYGLENFKVEILAIVETREESWDLEQKYIKEKNTKIPNGYNKANGGKTSKGANLGCRNSKDTEFKNKPVVRFGKNKSIKYYEKILDAANDNKGCYTSSIAKVCKGIRKSSGGFNWMYKEDYEKMKNGEVVTPPIIV